MIVIGCLGRKGGSGKSMISHLLAHGLSRGYGLFANVVMTDVREDQPINMTSNRDYLISSIKNRDVKSDSEELDKIFTQTAKIPDSILIIDGGANRANLDLAFAKVCDLILIPVGYGAEDVQVALADFWNIEAELRRAGVTAKIYIIRNRWPGATRERDRVINKPWISSFMQQAQRGSFLFPDYVPEMPSLLDMANTNDPKTTPLIDAVSARFAEAVAAGIGLGLPARLKLITYPTAAEIKRTEEIASGEEAEVAVTAEASDTVETPVTVEASMKKEASVKEGAAAKEKAA